MAMVNPWTALPEPELVMQILHNKGRDVVTSLLARTFSVSITIQLVGVQAQVHNSKEVYCQSQEIVYLSWLFTTIIWHVQVLGIIINNCLLPLSMRYFIVVILASSCCCPLDIGTHHIGLHDMVDSSLKDCLLFDAVSVKKSFTSTAAAFLGGASLSSSLLSLSSRSSSGLGGAACLPVTLFSP
jgi:hypothetical protein